MTNPNKRKGDKAEREAAEVLTKTTGFECKRNLEQEYQMMLEIFMVYQTAWCRYVTTRIKTEPVL